MKLPYHEIKRVTDSFAMALSTCDFTSEADVAPSQLGEMLAHHIGAQNPLLEVYKTSLLQDDPKVTQEAERLAETIIARMQ